MPTPGADSLTIVSGLPRSGTSMMMRMLEAGGLPALTDNLRQPDEDNPLGYYEFEPVKQTSRDASWIESARGKVVKMVYRLLYDLPADQPYRVILMRRNLDEVLASQRTMLQRHGKGQDGIDDARMAQLYRAQLEQFDTWVRDRPNFAVLEVNYNELLADPRRHAARVAEFLGGGLDLDAMTGVVDPSLYRNRR